MKSGTQLMFFSGAMAMFTIFMVLFLKGGVNMFAIIPGIVCFVSGIFGIAETCNE